MSLIWIKTRGDQTQYLGYYTATNSNLCLYPGLLTVRFSEVVYLPLPDQCHVTSLWSCDIDPLTGVSLFGTPGNSQCQESVFLKSREWKPLKWPIGEKPKRILYNCSQGHFLSWIMYPIFDKLKLSFKIICQRRRSWHWLCLPRMVTTTFIGTWSTEERFWFKDRAISRKKKPTLFVLYSSL